MVTACVFGGVAGLVIGMLIHHRGWVAVACLVVVAGVSALISRLGSTGSAAGLQLLVLTTLGLCPFGALRPWWHIALGFAAGVAWALLLLVPGWLLSPRSAEQSAVADAYHALADDLRAIGSDRKAQTRPAGTAALNTAYDTLLTARGTAGGRSRRMTHLMAVLDRLRGGQLAWTFTIRLMACVGVAAVASEVLPLQRSYWVVLTVAIVVKPDDGSVFARALQRGIGTIDGRGAGLRHPGGGSVRAVAAVPDGRAGGGAAVRPPPQLRPGDHVPRLRWSCC